MFQSRFYCLVAIAGMLALATFSVAQPPLENTESKTDSSSTSGVTYSNPIQSKWKVGVRIVGGASTSKNFLATIPVPTEWPEQRIAMANEDIPLDVGQVKFRELNSGVQQMVVTVPLVRAREETEISMTFLVTTSQIHAPSDTSAFKAPKSSHRAGKLYLGVSPDINYRNSKLRRKVTELIEDKESAWQEVESLFDWVRDNIVEQDTEPTDVVDVFLAGQGCREDKVCLFVAMCRAHKIPARVVWVEGTQYAEFMLVDSEANAHWFPANVVGIREFGSLSDPRVILQKGDSIRVPEKKARQKFVAEFATCKGRSKPRVGFIRELLPSDE